MDPIERAERDFFRIVEEEKSRRKKPVRISLNEQELNQVVN